MKKKVYLPEWQKKFIPPFFGVMWLFITYQQFFSGKPEMKILEYLLITVVFLGIGTMIWYMASGKLPAYEIEEDTPSKEKTTSTFISAQEERVLSLFDTKDRIANNDVERALGVSDSTATRYLQALEDKKVIVQRGNGSAIYYERT